MDVRTPTRVTKRTTALLLLASVLGQGCTSSMRGTRRALDLSGHEQMQGFPITLTKPVFMVTATPTAGGLERHVLAVKWIADPNQQYTVAIDPATFADPNFELTLGAHGNPTDLTAKVTDRVGPTVKAIGEFIGGITGTVAKVAIGGLGGGGVGDEESIFDYYKASRAEKFVWDEQRTYVFDGPGPNPTDCTYGALESHWRSATEEERKALDQLLVRLKGDIVAALPLRPGERIWLESVKEWGKCWPKTLAATSRLVEGLETGFAGLQGELNAPINPKASEAEKRRRDTVDLLSQIYGDIRRGLQPNEEQVKRLPPNPDEGRPAGTASLASAVAAIRTNGKEVATAYAKYPGLMYEEQLKLVRSLLDLDSNWRYHRVVALESQIDGFLRRAQQGDPVTGDLSTARTEWDKVVQVVDERRRIEAVTLRIADLEAEVKTRASSQYRELKETLLALQKAVQEKRTAIRLPEKPLGAPREFPVAVVDVPGGIPSSEELNALTHGADYVLVRRKDFVR